MLHGECIVLLPRNTETARAFRSHNSKCRYWHRRYWLGARRMLVHAQQHSCIQYKMHSSRKLRASPCLPGSGATRNTKEHAKSFHLSWSRRPLQDILYPAHNALCFQRHLISSYRSHVVVVDLEGPTPTTRNHAFATKHMLQLPSTQDLAGHPACSKANSCQFYCTRAYAPPAKRSAHPRSRTPKPAYPSKTCSSIMTSVVTACMLH